MNTSPDRKRRRRIAAAIIAGAATLGVVGASAATLGPITSGSLGASTGVVGSCDTDGVTLAYTTSYNPASGGYATTTVNVTSINAACNGKTLTLTLKDSGNASLGSGSAAVAAGAATVAVAADAAAVTGAAVVIAN
jgi:hypothetical protein